MKISKAKKVLIGTIAVVIVATIITLMGSTPTKGADNSNSMSLQAPGFLTDAHALQLQDTGTSFLTSEAGISAYVNTGTTIDLSKVKSLLRTVETETSDYIVGSLPLTGYTKSDDVHVYVSKSGWIVAYYLKAEPTSKIIDWPSYTQTTGITGTKLTNGIIYIGNNAGASVQLANIKYYNFQYPNANKMMVIIDGSWNGGDTTYNIELPAYGFEFNEKSVSTYTPLGCHYTYLKIDGKIELNGNCNGYGLLSSDELSLNTIHKVDTVGGDDKKLDAIVLVYKQI